MNDQLYRYRHIHIKEERKKGKGYVTKQERGSDLKTNLKREIKIEANWERYYKRNNSPMYVIRCIIAWPSSDYADENGVVLVL